uniref:Uncharacterized protein n=1 Tax=Anguilla anguilla TaxID=7936 RepID=A0A0E9Q2X3_ANGAN
MPVLFRAGAHSFIFISKCCRDLAHVLFARGFVELLG